MKTFKAFRTEAMKIKKEDEHTWSRTYDDKEDEHHQHKIPRKYGGPIAIRFSKEPHSNPNIKKHVYSTQAFEIDNGLLRPNHDGRYNKLYNDEKSWRAALNRSRKKRVK